MKQIHTQAAATKENYLLTEYHNPQFMSFQLIGGTISIMLWHADIAQCAADAKDLMVPKPVYHLNNCHSFWSIEDLLRHLRYVKPIFIARRVILSVGYQDSRKKDFVFNVFIAHFITIVQVLREKGCRQIIVTNIPPCAGASYRVQHWKALQAMNNGIKTFCDENDDLFLCNIFQLFCCPKDFKRRKEYVVNGASNYDVKIELYNTMSVHNPTSKDLITFSNQGKKVLMQHIKKTIEYCMNKNTMRVITSYVKTSNLCPSNNGCNKVNVEVVEHKPVVPITVDKDTGNVPKNASDDEYESTEKVPCTLANEKKSVTPSPITDISSSINTANLIEQKVSNNAQELMLPVPAAVDESGIILSEGEADMSISDENSEVLEAINTTTLIRPCFVTKLDECRTEIARAYSFSNELYLESRSDKNDLISAVEKNFDYSNQADKIVEKNVDYSKTATGTLCFRESKCRTNESNLIVDLADDALRDRLIEFTMMLRTPPKKSTALSPECKNDGNKLGKIVENFKPLFREAGQKTTSPSFKYGNIKSGFTALPEAKRKSLSLSVDSHLMYSKVEDISFFGLRDLQSAILSPELKKRTLNSKRKTVEKKIVALYRHNPAVMKPITFQKDFYFEKLASNADFKNIKAGLLTKGKRKTDDDKKISLNLTNTSTSKTSNMKAILEDLAKYDPNTIAYEISKFNNDTVRDEMPREIRQRRKISTTDIAKSSSSSFVDLTISDDKFQTRRGKKRRGKHSHKSEKKKRSKSGPVATSRKHYKTFRCYDDPKFLCHKFYCECRLCRTGHRQLLHQLYKLIEMLRSEDES